MKKGYASKEGMAIDAENVLNELMGELNAVRMVDLFASDRFLDSCRKGLKEKIGTTGTMYMRRLSLAAFASAMFKLGEACVTLLKPLGCYSKDTKELKKKIDRAKLTDWRYINEHIIDDKTGMHHSPEKIAAALEAINSQFEDLMGNGIAGLISQIEEIRNELKAKHPIVKGAVKIRFAKYPKSK
jgi:hypothetical protein